MNAVSIAMWSAGRRSPPTREDRVRAQGKTLWALLPHEFRAFFRRLSVQDGDTIAIIGPNTNFPWELVWPDDESTPLSLRRAMFGVTFAITRWPTTTLPEAFAVSPLDVIAPSSAVDPANPDEPMKLPSGLRVEFDTLAGRLTVGCIAWGE